MLVTHCKITCYSLQNSLVNRCRSCSLQKITRYSLQNSLVTRCKILSLLVAKSDSLLVAKFSRYLLQKLFVAKFTCYSLQKLLVAKKSLLTRCKIRLLLVATNHWLLNAKKLGERFSFFKKICFLEPKNSKLFQVNILSRNLLLAEHFQTQQYSATTCSKSKKWIRSYQISQLFFDLFQLTNTKLIFFEAPLFKFKSCLNGRPSMKTIYLWPKMKQLIALSQKNKQNRVLCPILQFQNFLENFSF